MDNKTLLKEKDPNEEMDVVGRVKQNKKIIFIILGVLVAVGLVIVGICAYRSHGAKQAAEAANKGDYQMLIEQNDSLAMQQYMAAAEKGYASGDRAALEVAMNYYQKGEYEQAAEYLQKAGKSSSNIVEAGRLSLLGDCYVNLDKLNDAVDCYQKAIKAAGNNTQLVPFILVKEANVFRAQGEYEKEYNAYNRILTDFPEYMQTHQGLDIRRYAERAKVAAGL